MIPIEAITTLGGLIIPPLFKLVRGIFGKKESQTPQDALDDVAISKPEILPEYIKGLAELRQSAIQWFNRDVSGAPSQWVIDLRAAIRPASVALCVAALIVDRFFNLNLDPGVRSAFAANIAAWFSDRMAM